MVCETSFIFNFLSDPIFQLMYARAMHTYGIHLWNKQSEKRNFQLVEEKE